MIRPFIRMMIQAPAGETSSSNAPEVKSSNADLYQNADANETFDDLDYESDSSKKLGDEYKSKHDSKIKKAKAATALEDDGEEVDEKPKKKEAKKEEKKSEKKTELDTLSDKEDGVDDKPKKEEKKAKDKEDDEDEEPIEADEVVDEKKFDQDKKDGKIKIRMADGLYGVDADAKVRVKVDGEFQEIPVQDLVNNYSGKTAWDKKFTELGNQKKEFETEKTQVIQTQEFLKKTVGEIAGILNDPNKNPFDALSFLVEKSGQDPYTLWKRSLEANLDEIEKLQSMDEHERKAYFLEKKDEFRTKADEARKKAFEDEQSKFSAIQKADALRQAQGVSEEQFMEAWDELEAQGEQNPTDEQIVEYASIKPHLASVQDVLEPYEDMIDDSKYSKIVTDFARQIRAKELTPEQLKEIAAAEFMDEDLKDLTVRKKAVEKKKEADKTPAPKGKHEYESFEDYL